MRHFDPDDYEHTVYLGPSVVTAVCPDVKYDPTTNVLTFDARGANHDGPVRLLLDDGTVVRFEPDADGIYWVASVVAGEGS